ncbi:hypothetical protein DL765_000110 [Monosporascus sp. GIB2]|nr:hypothetical protein DL765_000110 [Monosporascus sp. GIB2]
MEPNTNLRGAWFVRQAQSAQEHAHQARQRALHGDDISQDPSHNDIGRDPCHYDISRGSVRNYVTRGHSRNDNRHRPYPAGRLSRYHTDSAPRSAGPQGMSSARPPPPPRPKKSRIYVNRDPPEGATDLTHLPAVEGRHVLAVMHCAMARALNFDAERRAERTDECYEWRVIEYGTLPPPHVMAKQLPYYEGLGRPSHGPPATLPPRQTQQESGAGCVETDLGETGLGETELGETELGETELGETESGKTESGETELRGGQEEEESRSPTQPVDGQPWQGTIGRLRDYLGL